VIASAIVDARGGVSESEISIASVSSKPARESENAEASAVASASANVATLLRHDVVRAAESASGCSFDRVLSAEIWRLLH
jgi:hypothetical protein